MIDDESSDDVASLPTKFEGGDNQDEGEVHYEDVLVDARRPRSLSPQRGVGGASGLEARLPWGAPPLKVESSPVRTVKEKGQEMGVGLGGEDRYWTLRTTGWRRGSDREGSEDEEDRKSAASGARRLEPLAQPDGKISSFSLGSPVKKSTDSASQAGTPMVKTPVKKLWEAPAGMSPLLLVHGSSSSAEGVEQIGFVDDTPSRPRQSASPAKVPEMVVIDESSSPQFDDGNDDLDLDLDLMTGVVKREPSRPGHDEGQHEFEDMDGVLPGDSNSHDDVPSVEELFTMSGALMLDPEPATNPDPSSPGFRVDSDPPDQNPLFFPDNDDMARIEEQLSLPSIEDPSLLPEDDDVSIRQPHSPSPITRVPASDAPSMATPPSGQPPKRKRDLDPSDEEHNRANKKARHDARQAKKTEKKRLREERRAQDQQRQKEQQARQETERKRLALEKAHRRALELEIVVSSPLKAAEMGLGYSDGDGVDEESEIGSSPPVAVAVSRRLFGAKGGGSDRRVSWSELSERHASVEPESGQEDGAGEQDAVAVAGDDVEDDAVAHIADAVMGDAMDESAVKDIVLPDVGVEHAAVEEPSSQCSGAAVSSPSQAEPLEKALISAVPVATPQPPHQDFTRWALMEAAMGADAYSPFEIHRRLHLEVLNAELYGTTSHDTPQNQASGTEVVTEPSHGDNELSEPRAGGDIIVQAELATSLGASENTSAQSVIRKRKSSQSKRRREKAPLPSSESDVPIKTEPDTSVHNYEDPVIPPVVEDKDDNDEKDDDDEAYISHHSIRSPAPSPEYLAGPQAASSKEKEKDKRDKREKNPKRREKDAARKLKRRRKQSGGVYKKLAKNLRDASSGRGKRK